MSAPFQDGSARPLIIALGHRRRVGKDTVADILKQEYGFRPIAFARTLKHMMADLFPDLKHDQLFGDAKETPDTTTLGGQTPREMMIRLATAVRRRLGTEAFIQPVISEILSKRGAVPSRDGSPAACLPSMPWVVTDMRFKAEYRALQKLGSACFVRVLRPGVQEVAAEDELADEALWDYTLVNNGTVAQLSRAVRRLLTDIATGASQKEGSIMTPNTGGFVGSRTRTRRIGARWVRTSGPSSK